MKARFTPLAAAATLLLAYSAACGQGLSTNRPWYVGLTQDVTRDSNVLGTSSGEISDTISSTTLRGGFNQLFGRQRLRGDASLSHRRYKDLDERNEDGYFLGLTLDWATVERLSGALRVNSQRRQTDFSVGGITPVSLSNNERSDDVEFRARLGAESLLGLEAGAGHRQVSFSAPEYAPREYKQDRANFGVTYRPGAILTLSTGVSAAKTRFRAPEAGQPEADQSKRRDAYVSATWVPTGASTIDARVSYGVQKYDLATAADFEGATGAVNWTWRPTGKLSLTSSLLRETGQEAGFQRSPLPDEPRTTATDFSQVTNRAALAATYELTGKIGLSASASHARRTLVDRATGSRGRDNTAELSMGVRWAATRAVELGCHATRQTRSASGSGSSDQDSDRFGCFGSVTLD